MREDGSDVEAARAFDIHKVRFRSRHQLLRISLALQPFIIIYLQLVLPRFRCGRWVEQISR